MAIKDILEKEEQKIDDEEKRGFTGEPNSDSTLLSTDKFSFTFYIFIFISSRITRIKNYYESKDHQLAY